MPNKDPLKHFLKTNDTGPPLRRQLIDQDTGAPRDLTGATVLHIVNEEDGTTLKFKRAAVIEDPPTSGHVRADFQASDTTAAGKFPSEFDETALNGEIATYPPNRDEPSKRSIFLHIGPDLGE